jgi:hypothetical protein
MTCHEVARAYRALGLHPIPCAPRSKRPLAKWERYQTEPPLLDELDVWWEETPDANVALVLGRGTFAVDLDGGAVAERLLAEHGITLPASAPRSQTAHGFHVFLAADGPIPDRVGLLRNPDGKAAVDIRGRGIVVAPPSIHPTGARYEWVVPLTLPLPPAPPALLALIRNHRPDSSSDPAQPRVANGSVGSSWVLEALRGTPEGQRDATCTRLAGYLLGKGLDAETVTALLTESFARRCSPPFPEGEVRKCVQSIARREGIHGTFDRTITPIPIGRALDALDAHLTSGPPRVIPTPFPGLNRCLGGGLGPGELVYLGARPGVGKTAMALAFARTAASHGEAVVFVSREMVTLALSRRLVAQEGRVSATALKRARLAAGERVQVADAMRRLRGLPIWLTDEAVSLREITELVTGCQPQVGFLIVDYLQLVRAPAEVRERRLQVEAVSQGLKTLAVQWQMPVLCLSSLSRPAEGKEPKPTLASLRESGELEHDADLVLLLHRAPRVPDTECIVAKNRDGETGLVTLQFRAEWVSFDEVSDRAEGEG